MAGRFTIKSYLGEGGMATVYAAEQDAEPNRVALKVMNADLMTDRTFVRRFQREAKAAAKVHHPNSVQIIDYGVAGDLLYIAMELLVGDDLYSLLEREGAIAQGRAVRILIEVCDALMVAHEMGIVHRDLKPENIMVVADPTHPSGERVKVLDFGIAKLIAQDALDEERGADPRGEQASAVTRAGTFIGTPAYMSPEQCGLLPVDTRADIYTCGVLLFQLITGRLPFEGQTPLHTATLHIHQAPPPPSTFAPEIDPRIETLILKALSKKPAERHQTARHLGSALRKLLPDLADVPVAATRTPARRPVSSVRPGVTASGGAPPPSVDPDASSDRMESAKTLVAEGMGGPPPAILFHPDSEALIEPPPSSDPSSDPPARIRQAPAVRVPVQMPDAAAEPDDDSADGMRTLLRTGQGNGAEAPADKPRFGPQKTEVMEPLASGRPSSPGRPPEPKPAPSAARVEVKPVEPPRAEERSEPARPLAPAEIPAPIGAARRPGPAAPPAAADTSRGPMAFADTHFDMSGAAQQAQKQALPTSPAFQKVRNDTPEDPLAQLSGKRGLLIGFLAGALIVLVMVVVYLVFLRPHH
ncbi:MAG: protein kinase [Byssovorax sp.]